MSVVLLVVRSLFGSAVVAAVGVIYGWFAGATASGLRYTDAFPAASQCTKIKDAHRLFWRLSCFNMLAAIAIWWLGSLLDSSWRGKPRCWRYAFSCWAVLAVVVGMLYKIVAFSGLA